MDVPRLNPAGYNFDCGTLGLIHTTSPSISSAPEDSNFAQLIIEPLFPYKEAYSAQSPFFDNGTACVTLEPSASEAEKRTPPAAFTTTVPKLYPPGAASGFSSSPSSATV